MLLFLYFFFCIHLYDSTLSPHNLYFFLFFFFFFFFAFYLFWLLRILSLRSRFVLLLEKIQFLSYGARGVMVIAMGNGHGDTSSNAAQG